MAVVFETTEEEFAQFAADCEATISAFDAAEDDNIAGPLLQEKLGLDPDMMGVFALWRYVKTGGVL